MKTITINFIAWYFIVSSSITGHKKPGRLLCDRALFRHIDTPMFEHCVAAYMVDFFFHSLAGLAGLFAHTNSLLLMMADHFLLKW